ncbi:MAG: homocysteine S-methyltransferase [Actinomycetes bacterium]
MRAQPPGPNDAASLPAVLTQRAVVLDGGLATQLEADGHDLSGVLWSARLLAEQPDAVVAAHRAYLEAGAEVIETASYQASFEGFERAGIDRRTGQQLLRRSVELARQAIEEWGATTGGAASTGGAAPVVPTGATPGFSPRWVAASVGPYGAMLADGSEYTGTYGVGGDPVSVEALRRFHRPRLEALAEAEPDVFAVETVPCLREVEAVASELEALGLPGWISVTVADGRLRSGESLGEAFDVAATGRTVIAVGVNCSAPEDVDQALAVAAASRARDLPLVVYPNSGEGWDASTGGWRGTATFGSERVHDWLAAGARLVGGCCRVGPEQIAQLARLAD